MSQLLEGIRILDVSQIMAGPYCTMILGDMGADVIKVEKINGGDDSRQMGPYIEGESSCFMQINRNKRGIGLNLKDERALNILYSLVKSADVFIENYRPGVTQSLKIDYESLKKINPGIVYCSISGYGQTGPYKDKGGFDLVAQGMTGMMYMTGEPGGRPLKTGMAVYDIGAGLTAAYSILAAYIYKQKTGKGQHIDVAIAECGIPWFIWEAAAYFAENTEPQPTGSRHRVSAPYQVVAVKDGFITLGCANQRTWERFCNDVVKRPCWIEDARFLTNQDRQKNIEELEKLIETELATAEKSVWLERCDAAGVPAGPVNKFSDMLSDEHYIERGIIQQFEHQTVGKIKTLGFASKFSATPPKIRYPSPTHGQHTLEVLKELGINTDELEQLQKENVVL